MAKRKSDDWLRYVSEDVRALNPELFDGDRVVLPDEKRKYGERKVMAEEGEFDSGVEYRRYLELVMLERAGHIQNLQRQIRFVLQPGFRDGEGKRVRAITYTADFVYQEGACRVIEDVKSSITAKETAFRLRWRLLQQVMEGQPNVALRLYPPPD